MINAFGPEVIGENVEGKVLSMEVAEHSGRTYYQYELEPPHALITATAAGNRIYLLNITANGNTIFHHFQTGLPCGKTRLRVLELMKLSLFPGLQWKRHYKDLKQIADSFRVI